mgnify:FL=1
MGFFSNLSGGQQRSDIRRSTAQANSMIDQGFNESQGYYDQAAGLYDPYTQQGGKAATMYADLLGINGGDARSEAQGVLTSDPLFQGGLAQDSNALLKQLNARGQSGGGLANIAAQRVLQQNYGSWLDRYNQAGQQGFQATNALAGVRATQGDNAYGAAATKAGLALGKGNALASTRNTGINNLLGAIGTGLKAYSSFYKPV